MPPHLHPRSTATSTLFAGTLLASFTVVAIPHIFPCPRPRHTYADTEQPLTDADGKPIQQAQQRRKKKRKKDADASEPAPSELPSAATKISSASSSNNLDDETALFAQFQAEAKMLERKARECPVPKPGGVLGRLLGFQEDEKGGGGGDNPRVRGRVKFRGDSRPDITP